MKTGYNGISKEIISPFHTCFLSHSIFQDKENISNNLRTYHRVTQNVNQDHDTLVFQLLTEHLVGFSSTFCLTSFSLSLFVTLLHRQ